MDKKSTNSKDSRGFRNNPYSWAVKKSIKPHETAIDPLYKSVSVRSDFIIQLQCAETRREWQSYTSKEIRRDFFTILNQSVRITYVILPLIHFNFSFTSLRLKSLPKLICTPVWTMGNFSLQWNRKRNPKNIFHSCITDGQ